MDGLTALFDGPRARGAFALCSALRPPWALRVQDRAPLTLVSVARGSAWILRDGAADVLLGAGDVALLRGPDPYVVADDPTTPPQAVIHPGQRCTTPDGSDLGPLRAVGTRTWGNDRDGPTLLVTGTYERDTDVGGRVLRALPGTAVLRREDWPEPLVAVMASEVTKDLPGQAAVLDRLLDVVAIAALRAWLSRADADAPGWFRAAGDPVIGPALERLHRRPELPWTVARLADDSGLSRAAFAERFHRLVGEPPMRFLTGWRMSLAADRLCDPDATIAAVADTVGYGSAFALSTAFKRERGISPAEWRRRRGSGEPEA